MIISLSRTQELLVKDFIAGKKKSQQISGLPLPTPYEQVKYVHSYFFPSSSHLRSSLPLSSRYRLLPSLLLPIFIFEDVRQFIELLLTQQLVPEEIGKATSQQLVPEEIGMDAL